MPMRRRFTLFFAVACASAAFAGNAFYALGVADAESESLGWAVSADGSTIVGFDSGQPFFWSRTDGKIFIESTDLDLTSAVGVSADGSVIVGNAATGTGQRAWRWVRGQEIELLPLPLGYLRTRASGVSADGMSVAGTATNPGSAQARAFRWSPDESTRLLTPDNYSEAYAISAGGDAIAGGFFPPFVWREDTGFIPLARPEEAEIVYAYAISGDGSIQAGEAASANDPTFAIEWRDGDYTLLDHLPEATYSAVYTANGDGSVLAGRSSVGGLTGLNAAVWDAQRRVIDPNAYLDSLGIDRGGLHLTFIRGISHDGRVLAGWGERDIGDGETRREAWVATLELPMSCAADMNRDQRVDFKDVNAIISAFGCIGEGCPGDANLDGRVDFLDLNDALTRFGIVCIDAPDERTQSVKKQ
jgi:uncharacterized membrane protein